MKRIQAERSVLSAFGATVAALVLLVVWTRELRVGWLVATGAAVLVAAGFLFLRRPADSPRAPRALRVALVLLALGVGAAAVASWSFHRLANDWEDVVAERREEVRTQLGRRMGQVVAQGQEAARRAAATAAGARTDTALLFRALPIVQVEQGVDAIAVYGETGDLIAWTGDHRGPLPDTVWQSAVPAHFEERPLFSYLYFTARAPGSSATAVAAVLVETGIVSGDDGGMSDVVAARTETRASFRAGGGEDAVWSLVIGADTVAHARPEPLTQNDLRQALVTSARRWVLPIAIAALLALSIGWLRMLPPGRPAWLAVLPLLLTLLLGAIMPLGTVIGTAVFSPLLFAVPLPIRLDVSLGRSLAVLLPLAALIAGARHGPWARRRLLLGIGAGGLLVAVAYPLTVSVMLHGATTALLRGTAAYWFGLQVAGTLLLTSITFLALPRVAAAADREGRGRPPSTRMLLTGALALSAVLALATAARVHPQAPVHPAYSAFWAVPFFLAALALSPLSGRAGGVSRWLMAGWLAGTAVLPHLWSGHVRAQLEQAESELQSLGSRSDPYLEYLLLKFARESTARFHSGESGVQLLYRTWVASGLANEPYPSRISLWTPEPLTDSLVAVVQLGTAATPEAVDDPAFRAGLEIVREEGIPLLTEHTEYSDLSRLLVVPLADGSLVTVMVPPRRTLDRPSSIAPFLGGIGSGSTRLNLVDGAGAPPLGEEVEWQRTPDGWRSEAAVQYPEGWYHAHLSVVFPPVHIRLARGALLLTFDMALLALVWVLGVTARGGAAVPRSDWAGWLRSFRARVTVALFGFFLVPTAVFGWVGYTALSSEVARAAQTVAQHSVAQAVREFQEGNHDLRDLSAHAGTDVLRYFGGELFDVSSQEALDLGVYSAWMPAAIYERLDSGEDQAALDEQQLGSQSYVTAYHALRPTGTLGVPMSLSTGESAERQREFAHLVLFAVVVGALLSLALSVAVGRALAGPIGLLSRASAAVGAGRVRIRLPENSRDEFGQLYASFNRMTRRLRRARMREVRTARVLAWGEMARQVAHEIKNPLTPIKLSVQHLRRAYADRRPDFEEILDSNVSQILSEIDRLSDIARAFSRYGAPSLALGPLTNVDVGRVVHEALTLYRSGDVGVRYVEDVPQGLAPVRARPDELKEVLLNLVENSRAALENSGEIIVSAYEVDGRVDLEVSDNGPGVPPELLSRIFEPHFSTRSSGTGLGLAIVRRLVESWGATVSAESEPGGGTTVRIRLSISDS